MAVKTTEQMKERATALRKKLAEKGSKMDGAGVRALKKRIRRVQRRRRKVIQGVARREAAAKKIEQPKS